MNNKQYWLVSTDHIERLWFKDDEDFKAGMNFVPVIAFRTNVSVLAFVLMSNHVHFVLKCEEEKAERFIEAYKKRYSQYYSNKYPARELLRGNGIDVRPLPMTGDAVEKAIAYVQMNPVHANICFDPQYYRWGTGTAFFNATPVKGVLLESMSIRARCRIMHGMHKVPKGLVIGEEGYILPKSYIDVSEVEALFLTPKRMLFFLRNTAKAKNLNTLPSFKDQVILGAITDFCLSVYHKADIKALNEDELSDLLKQLRFRFSSEPRQLARVTGLSYEEIARLLDQ